MSGSAEDWAWGARVGAELAVGLEADKRWDRSRTEVDRDARSSAEATSLVRTEEMALSVVRSSPFSLVRAMS